MLRSLISQYEVNWKFLAKLFLSFAVIGTACFFLHRYNIRRFAEVYRQQMTAAKEQGNVRRELDYLRRYLVLQPKDSAARLRLGLIQAQLAVSPRDRLNAFFSLQEAIQADPSVKADVRIQSIKLALHPSVNLFEEAKQELDPLLKAEPKNGEYCRLMAESLSRARNFKEASVYLDRAIENDPSLIAAFASQAYLKRYEFNRTEEADTLIRELVIKNPESAEAQVLASQYWRAAGKRELYIQAVLKAKELAPNDPEVQLTTAEFALGRADDARMALKTAEQKTAITEAVQILVGLLDKLVPTPTDSGFAPNSPEEKRQLAAMQAYQLLVSTLLQNERQAEGETWARKYVATFPDSGLAKLDLADALISRSKLEEANEILGTLFRAGFPSPQLDYQRGRILILQEKWLDACRMLEVAVSSLGEYPLLVRRASLLLALCYEETGELDRRYEAFRRAMPPEPTDPTWIRVQSGIAETLVQMGRVNEAIAEYQRLASLVPEARIPLARLYIGQILQSPKEKQDWTQVDRVLTGSPEGPELELIKAELASLRASVVEARRILDAAILKTPDSARLWTSRIFQELRENKLDRANELYQQAVAKLGDSLELRLVKLRLVQALPQKQAAESLPALAENLESLSNARQLTLYRALIDAAEQLGRRDLARKWIDQLLAKRPYDQSLQSVRLDFAMLDDDEPKMLLILDEIAQLSGSKESVPARVSRAFYLVWKSGKTKDPQVMKEASGLLIGLERQRIGWSRLFLAQARVSELGGDLLAASKRYRQAIDLGERSPDVFRRLLEIYYLTKQYSEADLLIRQSPTMVPTALGAELMTELSLGAKNYTRAIEMATKAVQADSKDPEKLLWLARVMVLSGQLEDAIPHLRRVTQLAPKRPDTWVAWVQLLTALKRPDEALALLETCKKELEPRDLPLVLAQCLDTIGRTDEATKWYAEALKQRAGDPNVIRAVASWNLRQGDTTGAQKLLEQLLSLQSKSKDDELFARRLLAIILSSNRDYATSQRSLEVLGLASIDAAAQVTNAESIDDLRTRVQVLSRLQGRKARTAAVKLLQNMEGRAPLTLEDQILLAELEESLGDWIKARSRYSVIVNTPQTTPRLLAGYIARLIRHGDWVDARRMLDQLDSRDPKGTANLALHARLEAGQGRPQEAISWALKLEKPEIIASVLEDCGLITQAEQYYKKYSENTGTPAASLSLVGYYGRANRFAPAWAELEKLWNKVPAESLVPFACQVLLNSVKDAAPADVAKFSTRVDQAALKSPSLQVFQSIVKSLAGDHRGAIDLSREILAREPNNLVALNNLAFLVGTFESQPEQGLSYLQQAIKVAGPLPALLDTEAYLLLMLGRTDLAIGKLLDSLASEQTGVTYIHLAQAYLKANRTFDAREALTDARRLNVRIGDFHPLEQPSIQAFLKNMDPK
jgi:cellulose synthase operon protein C